MPELGTERWLWVIFEKDKREDIIGCVDIWRDGKPENRGFWLTKEHWGKVYMTEAVKPVIDYSFDSLGFEKMVFANAVGNDRSRWIKEKTGAILIGVEPAKFVDPKYTEHELWELIKENWEKFKAIL